MSFKFQDDRQVIQRAALATSIGSAANSTLDIVFARIDSVMVNLNGTQTLTNKTLAFLQTNVITDSTTTGSAATLPSGDIADGVVRLTNASLTSISGITAGGTSQFITIENQTGNTISINNDDSGASVGNRIYTGTGTTISLISNTTVTLNYDATVAHWMLQGVTSGAKSPPTQQIFTGGSGTYTTPVGVLYIEVEMVGGGGGGGSTVQFGGSGGITSFGTSFLVANGGGGGGDQNNFGGSGGTTSIGVGAIGVGFQGGSGGGAGAASGGQNLAGGMGASTPFGGAGGAAPGASAGGLPTGLSAIANTGSGGGGCGNSSGGFGGGGGGGAGGYIKVIITSPSPTYPYSVGTSGSPGSVDGTGGVGGTGIIIVREYYQ